MITSKDKSLKLREIAIDLLIMADWFEDTEFSYLCEEFRVVAEGLNRLAEKVEHNAINSGR